MPDSSGKETTPQKTPRVADKPNKFKVEKDKIFRLKLETSVGGPGN